MSLKWLVVGIGDVTTKRVIPAILAEPRSTLAGIVTRDVQKARPYTENAWTDLTAALNGIEIDAVYVASPVFLHAPQSIESLNAGKHVLCEKPMAMNYAEACEMQNVAERNGGTLGIAYYRRTYPKIKRAKELLEAGVIGTPLYAELTSHAWFDPRGGTREWLTDPLKCGGGPLYDIASHRIDLLNHLFGRPIRVSAHMSNAIHDYQVEDNATIMIDYENGARGIVDVRWNSKIQRDECRIRGTDGEIEMSPLNGPDLIYPGGREHLPAHANLHFPCVQNFVETVLDGAPLLASGASSLVTDWVTEQAMKSQFRYHSREA